MRVSGPEPSTEAGHLAGKVMRASIWMVTLSATGWLIGYARLLVVARLLDPYDFGLVGIALAVTSLLESFSTTGTAVCLIARQAPNRAMFDTAWTVGLIRGGLITGLLVLGAPEVAWFFRAPEAEGVIRVMAFVPLIRSLTNVGFVEFRRTLAFSPQYVYHTGGVLADLCVVVPLAWVWGNAWALVAGSLAATSMRVALTYRLHPYRPSLCLDRDVLQDLAGYGRWIFGSVILRWCLTSGVQGVVCRLLGVGSLGLYQMAWRLSSVPASEATQLLSSVTLPAYARLQDLPGRLQSAYLRVLRVVTLVAMPVAISIMVLAQDMTRLLMDEAWSPVVPLIRVLALCGLAQAITSTTPPLFQGIGRPKLETLMAALELGCLVIALVPLTRWGGAVGVAWAVTIAALVVAGVCLLIVRSVLRVSAAELWEVIGIPLMGMLPVAALHTWGVGSLHTISALGAFLLSTAGWYMGWLLLVNRLGVYPLRHVVPLPWRFLATVLK